MESRGKKMAQLAVLALQKNNEEVFLTSRPVLSELDANCETLETNNIQENIVSEKCQGEYEKIVQTHQEDHQYEITSQPYTSPHSTPAQSADIDYGKQQNLIPSIAIENLNNRMPPYGSNENVADAKLFLSEQMCISPSKVVEQPVMISNGVSHLEQKTSLKLKLKRVAPSKNYRIDSSSDKEPFPGDDSDEYLPSSGISSPSSPHSNSESINGAVDIFSDENADDLLQKKKEKNDKEIAKNGKKNKRKYLRNSGKQYLSSRGKIVEARKMGPPCKCRFNCANKLPEEVRKTLFRAYWALGSLQRQRDYLSTCCEVSQVQYRRIKTNSEHPRKPNCSFFLLQEGKKIQVCKSFLLSTLAIKERSIRTVMTSKFNGIGTTPDDKRGTHAQHSKLDEEIRESVRAHILSIPRVESHYVRASTSREFIDGGLTIAELHRNYDSLRKLANKPSANYDAYSRIFNTQFNIGFHVPKKDQCDQCEAYKNSVGDEKLSLEESYKKHMKQKELSRQEKAEDIKKSEEPGTNQIVAIYDLQAVMPVPIGDSSAFFYHSKLNCYNFTVTDTNTKITRCYFWHEGLAHRGAIEIGSCVFKYLNEIQQSHPNCNIIFYSDNCCGQQKNRFILSMYLYVVTHLNNNSITHKFLIRGHTQNEGDTAHSLIEKNIKRSKKSGPIYVPDQYISLIRTAKKRGEPFRVNELTFGDFYDLKSLAAEMGFNTTKNVNGDQIKLTEIKMVEFKKGMSTFRYKLGYDEEWIDAPIRTSRSKKTNDVTVKQAYKSKIPITGRKKDDLLKLLNTNIVPKYYGNFYNTLF